MANKKKLTKDDKIKKEIRRLKRIATLAGWSPIKTDLEGFGRKKEEECREPHRRSRIHEGYTGRTESND